MKYKSFIKFFACMFWVLITQNIMAQEDVFFKYKFPDHTDQDFYALRRKEYMQLTGRKAPDGVKKYIYKSYSEMLAYGKASKFLTGEVYLNWTEMEGYMNNVLQKIIPENHKNKQKAHIYPVRDATYNAAALHDGTMFFNIGLFADAENEAAVAAIMGHEYAHFFNDDLEKAFLSRTKKKKKKDTDKKLTTFNLVHEDQKRETVADTMGYRWASLAGYDASQAVHNYYRFIDETKTVENEGRFSSITNVYVDEKDGKKIEKSISQILSSHPETADRIELLQKYVKENHLEKGKKNYLLSTPEQFKKLQALARSECLNLLLQKLEYKECVSRAFYYHLFEPTNKVYLYYLAEGLRRTFYLEPEIKEKYFLNEKYGNFLSNNGLLLKNLNLVVRDTVKMKFIKSQDLKDTSVIEFTTYQEAFKYFGNLCIKNKVKESVLTLALAADHIQERDSLLKIYLQYDQVENKRFAEKLLSGSLINGNNNKELILSEGVEMFNYRRTGAALNFLKSESKNIAYYPYLHILKKDFPNVELLFVSQVMKQSFADAIQLKRILYSSILLYNYRGNNSTDDIDLFMLDPDYFQVFEKYKLKTLSFINVDAMDDQRKIWRVANIVNPFFYMIFPYYVRDWVLFGTERYEYDIQYLTYDPARKEKISVYSSSAHYKLTPMNYINSIYYALIDK